MPSKLPPCANCGREYVYDHLWRSAKGACRFPPAGQRTFYLDPAKLIKREKGDAA